MLERGRWCCFVEMNVSRSRLEAGCPDRVLQSWLCLYIRVPRPNSPAPTTYGTHIIWVLPVFTHRECHWCASLWCANSASPFPLTVAAGLSGQPAESRLACVKLGTTPGNCAHLGGEGTGEGRQAGMGRRRGWAALHAQRGPLPTSHEAVLSSHCDPAKDLTTEGCVFAGFPAAGEGGSRQRASQSPVKLYRAAVGYQHKHILAAGIAWHC